MDAWITPEPVLKFRSRDLSGEDQDTRRRIPQSGKSQSVLASALQTSLEKGRLGPHEKSRLYQKLAAEALKRITEARKQWAELTEDGVETFASIWAKGTVSEYFPSFSQRCTGIADKGIPPDADLTERYELNFFLNEDLDRLINDAINYIEWTLKWPEIVQVVRSIEQGTVRTDISWRP